MLHDGDGSACSAFCRAARWPWLCGPAGASRARSSAPRRTLAAGLTLWCWWSGPRLGPHGFRAVLWHQGESDANQKAPTRTLPGDLYRQYLAQLIRDSRREIGWEAPWFVAQVSYHVPGDEASPDIRAAQASLWKDGLALAGPDSDALKGKLRERNGQGVHFSGPGLREHAARWAEKVTRNDWKHLVLDIDRILPRETLTGIVGKTTMPRRTRHHKARDVAVQGYGQKRSSFRTGFQFQASRKPNSDFSFSGHCQSGSSRL